MKIQYHLHSHLPHASAGLHSWLNQIWNVQADLPAGYQAVSESLC